ncbi:hypothetical protein CEXT_431361 [Caerostris extrusa]|uniref:Uncharacterized protein n=1 Tax=Caerostris extrusa TaxID=172846 RepID=A0AAV4TMW3_CAEEX|nr:hypothetical protein CEXT_431361 [Caerostris extrusa]
MNWLRDASSEREIPTENGDGANNKLNSAFDLNRKNRFSLRRSRPKELERNRNSSTRHSHRLFPHHHCHCPVDARYVPILPRFGSL